MIEVLGTPEAPHVQKPVALPPAFGGFSCGHNELTTCTPLYSQKPFSTKVWQNGKSTVALYAGGQGFTATESPGEYGMPENFQNPAAHAAVIPWHPQEAQDVAQWSTSSKHESHFTDWHKNTFRGIPTGSARLSESQTHRIIRDMQGEWEVDVQQAAPAGVMAAMMAASGALDTYFTSASVDGSLVILRHFAKLSRSSCNGCV